MAVLGTMRIGTFLVGLVLIPSSFGCGPADRPSEERPAGVAFAELGPAPAQKATRYEIKFMMDMIDHHMAAVHTGSLCAEKAVHEELRALCANIVAAQAAEIATMQSWLQDWYGIDHAPETNPRHEKMMADLAALTGAEFEVAFMEMMIDHHEGAVREGRRCVERAYHEELVALCENIISSQLSEIEAMTEWLCEWYDAC